MMRVTVLEYNDGWQAHKCKFDDGRETWIDLTISGDLKRVDPKELVGKAVEFHRMTEFMYIAHTVRLAEAVS